MDHMVVQIHEKIHVVLRNEMQEEEGLLTLNWVIKKWGSSHHPFSIVIFFIISSSSRDFVNTPFGKLPASSVSDEKLLILRKCEQQKIDSLLSRYANFCGKVKTEIHKFEKHDEPIQKTILELITEHRITKLVMGMTFMKSSSGRSKSAISGSFYVHKNKPEFCELYIVCRGKLMVLKEETEVEGHLEDEQGVIMAKLKNRGSWKGWFGKKLSSSNSHGHGKSPACPSSPASMDSNSTVSRNNWENYEQEIDDYYQELLSLRSKSNAGEERENDEEAAAENRVSLNSPTEQDILSSIKLQDGRGRIEALKKEIRAVQKMMELHKNKEKEEVDRQAKALWAICLCNHRVEELEARKTEEITTQHELAKELDNTKEQVFEILADVEESKNRLSSLLELQSELSTKLQTASLAKLGAETQLGSAVSSRTALLREIEQLRGQRDVFQRRIEFCKEKDAIEMATRMSSSDQVSCSYREFSTDEIRLATDNFAPHRRLKSGGDWTNVYKGRIKSLSVAIRMLDSEDAMSHEVFQAKVNLLADIRHPHITALIGFCLELKCFVFEYMHNGCLRDILFSSRKARVLQWHHRVQIAAQVSSGLGFLHLAQPTPVIHGGLNPSSIFLDRNLVAKIHPLKLTPCSDQAQVQADVCAIGNLVLQLLTGRNWAGLDQESMMINKEAILDALDDNAGGWPLDLAEEVAQLALKCRSVCFEPNLGVAMSSVTEELNNLKKVADDLVARWDYLIGSEDFSYFKEDSGHVPNIFICPIFQVVMENPHIAADGYSYELEAIEEWLRMGHDTSPVTNSKLNHKHLIPNKTLRFLIQDWQNKRS